MKTPSAGLWHNARVLHLAANSLLGLALLALLGAAAYWFTTRPGFTLRAVSIEASAGTQLRFVSSAVLRNSSTRVVEGNFFTVDLDDVRARYEALPWVRRAAVRRVWPDSLVVTIEEHRPLALWGAGRVMNTYGELFAANLAEAEEDGPLPELSGPTGSHASVLARFRELQRWLAPLQRQPQAVSLSQRWAGSARLDDGTTLVLGREQGLPIDARVQRWVALYPGVRSRLENDATVVDLRYPNGFALRTASSASAASAASAKQAPAGAKSAGTTRSAKSAAAARAGQGR
ncbi:MAG: cell division protein FtsQ/DivIB [Burkholderiaceae bacterium]|nr:cell division protein FtsQ/DivIB [Burkholderiaceae bacterium]